MYIHLSPSSFEKDLGQTVQPLLDVQDVVTYPSTPLRGIGLYHKASSGYGGFIAPRILTYDYSKFIKLPDYFKEII